MSEAYRHRYRLPDTLGGGEFVGVEKNGQVTIDIPGTGRLNFPADLLRRVVPYEPDDGAWVTLTRPDCWPQDVYSRHDTAAVSSGQPADHRWWWHDEKRWVPWDAVYMRGAPARLTLNTLGGSMYTQPRGICTVCRKPQPIRLDGMISLHGYKRSGCQGGDKPPLVEQV